MNRVWGFGAAGVLVLALFGACDRGPLADRAAKTQRTLGAGRLPPDVHVAPAFPARFGVGRSATPAEIAALDVDVTPDGHGLLRAGTRRRGQRCSRPSAACHGAAGEGQVGAPPAGQAAAPKLVGRDPREGSRSVRTPSS
jgi:hypothetical protein